AVAWTLPESKPSLETQIRDLGRDLTFISPAPIAQASGASLSSAQPVDAVGLRSAAKSRKRSPWLATLARPTRGYPSDAAPCRASTSSRRPCFSKLRRGGGCTG